MPARPRPRRNRSSKSAKRTRWPKQLLDGGNRHRIGRHHLGARGQEILGHDQGRGLAHVVGSWLERQAPQGDAFAGEVAMKEAQDVRRQPVLLSTR